MNRGSRVVVIGGGITGTLTARELCLAGCRVTVLEAAHLGAGSSSRTGGGIRQQFSTPGTVRGMRYAVRFYRAFAAEVEDGTSPIVQNGYLFLYADPALSLLFGREFAGSATTARLLIPAYLVSILAGPLGVFINAFGKTHWTLANVVLRTLLNAALNLVLIPRFGIVGAAAGTLIALSFAVALHRWQLRSLVTFRGTYAGWGRPLAVLAGAAALSLGAARLWREGGIGGANADIVAGLVGGAVLLAAFWIGVRVVPGCVRENDLALLGFVRERLGR